MMTAAAMLSREGRRRGVRDNGDGEEEGVEVDDSNETIAASGGGGRRKGGFEESGEADISDWTDGGGDDKIDKDLPPSPPPPHCQRVIGQHGIGGKCIPIMVCLAKGRTLE